MGFEELRTAEQARAAIDQTEGTVLTFVNSVCGCAGGIARPGLALALFHSHVPDKLTTTFAGLQVDAVEYTRSLFPDYPPSSPQAALFKNGQIVEVIQRHQIEGTSPEHFADVLKRAFDGHCQAAPAD